MRYRALKFLAAAVVLPAAQLLGQSSAPAEPIGRVTAAFGIAAVQAPDGTRKGDLHTLINNGDRIRTNGGGVTVLLASRVVLKVDHDTTVTVNESPDQLNVVLERGTVHVFVGDRPLASGAVCVQDPQARIETIKGVFLASYDPSEKRGYYACEHATVAVEAGGKEVASLTPDKQLVIKNGRVGEVEELDRIAFQQHKVSLERLGQSVKNQGAEVFRLRTRAFDTELAINQLSEAGWIDRESLQSNGQQAAKKSSKNSKTEEGETNEEEQSNTTSNEGNSSSNSSSNSGSKKNKSSDGKTKVASGAAKKSPAKPVTGGVSVTESDDGQTEISESASTERPGMTLTDDGGTPPPVDIAADAPVAIEIEISETPSALPGLEQDAAPLPTASFELETIATDSGSSGSSGDLKPKKDRKLDLKPEVIKGPSAPKLDLRLENDSSSSGTGGAPAPKLDLNLSDTTPPAPKLDLKDTTLLAPKLDVVKAPTLDLKLDQGDSIAPPKLDLAPKTDLGMPNASDVGSTLPSQNTTTLAPPPLKIDLGVQTPTGETIVTKIDLNLAPAPTSTAGVDGSTTIVLPVDLALTPVSTAVVGGDGTATLTLTEPTATTSTDSTLNPLTGTTTVDATNNLFPTVDTPTLVPTPGELGVSTTLSPELTGSTATSDVTAATQDYAGHDANTTTSGTSTNKKTKPGR